MNGSYDRDHNLDEFDESAEPEREISLGTSTVLGIFFALALVCALFFGFGYTMGRRSAPSVAGAQESAAVAAASGSKPLSGSAESHAVAGAASKDSAVEGSADSASPAPVEVTKQSVVASDTQPSSPAAASAKAPVKVAQAPVAASPAVSSAAGSFVVQIAAVSHREDADILVTTLSRRGYNVTIRQEPQDKLLHVQIGPFANKKEADGMRQRLLADGYNAIVK